MVACEQPFTGDGHLTGDLTCGATDDVLINGGTLDLAGFTLTGGVACHGNCSVRSTGGRGSIVGGVISAYTDGTANGGVGVASLTVENLDIRSGYIRVTGNLFMKDVILEDSPRDAVEADDIFSEVGGRRGGNAVIERSTIRGAGWDGVYTHGRLSIEDSEISGSGGSAIASLDYAAVVRCTLVDNGGAGIAIGLFATRALSLIDSTVERNSAGIVAETGTMRISGSSVSQNLETGIENRGKKGTMVLDSVVDANGGHGLRARLRATVQRSTFHANGRDGVQVFGDNDGQLPSRLNIKDSTFAGNGMSVDCGVAVVCADIAVDDTPKVARTTCENSYRVGSDPPESWTICSFD